MDCVIVINSIIGRREGVKGKAKRICYEEEILIVVKRVLGNF